ncbi:MAG: hypothetical protein ABI216_13775 [Devosia sp.]
MDATDLLVAAIVLVVAGVPDAERMLDAANLLEVAVALCAEEPVLDVIALAGSCAVAESGDADTATGA